MIMKLMNDRVILREGRNTGSLPVRAADILPAVLRFQPRYKSAARTDYKSVFRAGVA